MSEIILDTETTGLSPLEGDRIIEIACIETEGLIPTNKKFHILLNPETKISEDAFKIHGFSNEFLKDKKKFKDIADEFLNFIEEKDLIIHNAPFDLGFLNNELRLANKGEINKNKIIDTLILAKQKFPGQSNSLDALCKRFNVDLSRRTKHNALLDCELLREVYIHIIEAKEPKLFTTAKKNEGIIKKNGSKVEYFKKLVKPTNEERSRHKIFLKKEIKKNFFY
jgi:DNA polymerase-3 subunit epsilon